ncbi:MAG TPA: TIGR03960 family B12-binding radical SAM protein, partial [bacterium]|nr:TIGR03960 family B12-binding radical SAM protein [bacterium]
MICGLSDRILFRLFQNVTRPGRYLDHEINLRRAGKGWLRFLLAFPDLYEIGMSNLGLRVLYHVISRHPDCEVDVAFAPWADMEDFMRKERMPLYGLGSGAGAGEFDIIGFSLQHELQYTNVLNMLDLAGLPLLARDRQEDHPLVVAGGPCAYNPEPMSAFIDAFAIGDGETLAVEIAEAVLGAKGRGESRSQKLGRLAEVPGCYVPVVHGPSGHRTTRRVEPVLKDEDFPLPPIVPIIPITHDRLTLEVMRGCTRGCRFCSAGMLTRPVRERPVDSVVALAESGIAATGWEEVSLVSLSTSDYKGLESLVTKLARSLGDRQVSISLPSMRPGTFSPDIAKVISGTRKTGLTFAPEAGTDSLRRSVNKDIDERDLYSTIETAFRGGLDSVKLYFMLGLPGETDADLDGLIRICKSVGSVCRVFGKRRHATVSLSPFVPRPLTPLQWEAQLEPEEILRRVNYIRKNLPDDRIRLKWRDPYMSLVEGLLARGDARAAGPIVTAWKSGARFDGWTDRFDFGLWAKSFESCNITISQAIAAREVGAPLPWDRVDGGVSRR